MSPDFRKLYPQHEATEGRARGLYEGIRFPRSPGRRLGEASRPYVVINMISTVDGKAQDDGRASGLGSEVDRAAMRSLRSGCDAVMIGAGTLRAERLSLGLYEAGRRQPLGIVVSSGLGALPLENLIPVPRQRVLLLRPDPETSSETGPQSTAGPPRILRHPEDGRVDLMSVPAMPTPTGRGERTGRPTVDLAVALAILREELDVGVLLVEGGPSLNDALVSQNLVDELFLTVSPRLLAGSAQPPVTIAEATTPGAARNPPTPLGLVSVHAAGDELFLRYALEPNREPT